MTKPVATFLQWRLALAVVLCAVAHQALLRTEFPGSPREFWDTLAPWMVWIAPALAALSILSGQSKLPSESRLRWIAAQSAAAAFVGFFLSALVDSLRNGMMTREAPFSASLGRFLPAAIIFALVFSAFASAVFMATQLWRNRRSPKIAEGR